MVVEEKLISAEEFWEFAHHPDFADKSLELVEGVLVVMSRPGAEHGLATLRVGLPMFQHVEQHDLGSVTVESGYITVYDANGTLDGGDVLPGFTLPVSAIFRR